MLDNELLADYLGPAYVGVRQLLPNETDLDLSDCTQLPAYWGNGTPVHPDTDESLTVCEASQLGTFAAGWMVAPNRIDWDFVFSNFDLNKNPTLYATEITVLVIFIIAIIWAREKDKKDVEKVFFKLIGEEEDSDIRQFTDSKRDIFQRSSTDGFLMATPGGGGDWASWYLDHMTIQDIQTGERWMFIANTWLAVEKGNGKVFIGVMSILIVFPINFIIITFFLTCLVSAAFVTFYGIQFEDATCREWITSLLISFFTSVFVLQPIKIFLLAVLQVLILKKTDDEFDDLEVEPTRDRAQNMFLYKDTLHRVFIKNNQADFDKVSTADNRFDPLRMLVSVT
nr:hypothetical protein BaRGS_022217 [Batillaria attramentaria]